MSAWLDVCRFSPVAGGTSDWAFSSTVTGYNSPTLAGAVNGRIYSYRAESNDLSQWEIGSGIYNSGTNTFVRTTVFYNSSGTGTGAGQSGAGTKINFSTVPQVAIVALKEDLLSIEEANAFTTTQKAQAQANIKVSGPTIQRFLSGTAQPYTTPANCTWIRIRLVGGGSGASGSGTGAGNAGTPTASTWSGGTLSAGGAAAAQQLAAGNAGGTASGGNIANANGEGGSPAQSLGSSSGSPGGNSVLGGAGIGVLGVIAGGNAATNSGSGGGSAGVSAAVTTGVSGGCGGYVEHVIVSPAATYTYTVGVGSTGGTAGTNGGTGGNGAAGIIIVEEYYN